MASINLGPNSRSYMIQNTGHAKAVQTKFCSLLEKSSLVDVDIICGDRLIRAHKCLLAANSPYFREQFQKDRSIAGFIVNGMDYCDVFKLMLLLYTGEASIYGRSLQYILKASQVFKIKWIQLLLTDKSYEIDPDIQIPLPLFFNKHTDLAPFYVGILKFPNLKPKSKYNRKTAQGSRSVLKPPNERFNNPARSAAVLKELSGQQNEFVSNLIIPKTADSSSNCTIVRENPGQDTAGEEITQPSRPVVKSTYKRLINPVRTEVVVQEIGQEQVIGNPGQKNAVEDVNQIPTSIFKTTKNCKNSSVAIEKMDVDQDEFMSNLMHQVSTDDDCANFTSFIRNIGQDAMEYSVESVIENLGKDNSENTSAISNMSEGNTTQACNIGFKDLYECFEDPIVIEKLDPKQDEVLSDLTVQVPFNVDDSANCTSVKSNLGQVNEMNLFNGYDRDVDFQLSLDEVMPLTNGIFPVCDNVIEKYLNDYGPNEPMEQEPFDDIPCDDIPCDVLINETLVGFILGPEEA